MSSKDKKSKTPLKQGQSLRTAKTMRVVGRGTLMIDPNEVYESDSYKDLLRHAKDVIQSK
ncbi:TPA: hypothetical protein OUZ96_000099 [Legionella pneumophila]|nr:hypothetical protein [Legionella pneumophila]